ncbi:MAG: hypothetical protein MK180_15360 [Rhodobacteraceae bacterium]|nr:hypothetical protein [Paracoccaceae bacterium]
MQNAILFFYTTVARGGSAKGRLPPSDRRATEGRQRRSQGYNQQSMAEAAALSNRGVSKEIRILAKKTLRIVEPEKLVFECASPRPE